MRAKAFLGDVAEMRRQHHVVELAEGMVDRQRLDREHVDRGARAMYLGSTVYRIHGTNQPSTIGKFVSSGCIGMLNEDVSDLFDHVKVGTRVVVLPGGPPPAALASAAAAPVPGPSAGGPPPAPMSGVPGMQPTAVPPLPAPVTVR